MIIGKNMKSKKVVKEITFLELDKDEVEWLKGMMQNSSEGLNETPSDESMRQAFWKALGGTVYRNNGDE